MKQALTIIMLICLMTGAFAVNASGTSNGVNTVITYKNIPGITQDEIDAIERLINEKGSFTYGHPSESETFKSSDGECTGFSIKIADWLSQIFGIPFKQEHFDGWESLKDAVDSMAVDFTESSALSREQTGGGYYITSPIAGRSLNIYSREDTHEVISDSGVHGMRLGFLSGTITSQMITSQYPNLAYEQTYFNSPGDACQALTAGEIDAFVVEGTADAHFDNEHNIKSAEFKPLVYIPIFIATSNPELEPIINAIDRYLLAGGINTTVEFYKESERDYIKVKLFDSFTDEEKEYINSFTRNHMKVPVGYVNDAYPNSFYNTVDKEYQGIAIDIMNEISLLTGLEFAEGGNTFGQPISALLPMLESGEISMITQMIYSDSRKETFGWSKKANLSTNYALVSRIDYPDLDLCQVPMENVGTIKSSVYEIIFNRWFPNHENHIMYATTSDAFDALELGEVDLIMLSDSMLLHQTNLNEKPGFKVNINFASNLNYYFGFNKYENTLRSIIDKTLEHINTNDMGAIWLNRTYDYSKQLSQTRAVYFLSFACALLIALILVILLLMRNKRLSRNLVERINSITLTQQSLQTVLDALPIPVRIVDLASSDIVYANDSLAELLEYNSAEELHGLNLRDILPKSTFDGTPSASLIDTIINSRSLVSFEVDYKTKTNKIIESLLSTRHIHFRGKPSSIGIIKDLTQEKERAEMLLAAAEREREANQSKSVFLANMSHEIRTPMNGIIGFSELALDSGVGMEAKDDYIKKIKASGEGLLQIIDDILDISKIEAGKVELENIPFDMHEVFRICQTIITPKAIEKGISLYCYTEPSVGKKLLGDPTKLRQVLLNLLSNAVKFTNTGMVKLLSAIESSTDNSVTMRFEVKDNGIGMSSDQIKNIFKPFLQADNTTTRKYGGTGLGLAITKTIIEMMGGELAVESAPGIGSKFSFELTFKTIDIDEDISEQKVVLDMTQKPMFSGEILVFEDNYTNQQVIHDHLSRIGLTTVMASNGQIGVDIVRKRLSKGEKPFDLIFMDIHMPVMDGLEAARMLMDMGIKTPIVAVTANIMKNDKEIYRTHGMPDHIAKPFQTHELWACLLKYLTPIKTINTNAHEDYLDDEKRRKKLQINFAKDYKNAFEEISRAVKTGDIILAHRLAHTIKSLAALFNKTALQEAARMLEQTLSAEEPNIPQEQLDTFGRELCATLLEFSRLTDEENSRGAGVNYSRDELISILKQLRPLLESSNTDSLDWVERLRGIPGMNALIELVESYDFTEAIDTLDDILNGFGGN